MSQRDVGAEILGGIREIQQYKKGKVQFKTAELSEP
jgi:putative transcriptional regulator|tara:strand:- start:12033 stop:12140 length:108 start_codon:yes stop_codon:yes gene_type:complete